MRLHNFFSKPDRIFLNAARSGGHPNFGGGAEDEEETREELQRQRREELEEQRDQREMMSRIERGKMSQRTKQYMREDLAGNSFDRYDLVDRFLRGEIESEDRFLQMRGSIEKEERSWSDIGDVQRKTRQNIAQLQYRAESYLELIPRKRVVFEGLLKDARGLNRRDEKMDRDLKRELHRLVKGDPESKFPAGILSEDDAKKIFLVEPASSDFVETLSRYKERIEAAPGGRTIYKKILALKKEESRIERDFQRTEKKFNQMVQDNLKKTKRKLEEERILKEASKAVGIRLKVGTKIKFRHPENMAFDDDAVTATITDITFDEEIQARDPHTGKPIDIIGIPFISLVNGTQKSKVPLGRFKKWVDAVDACEDMSRVEDVEHAAELEPYGIKVKSGMTLTFPKRTQDAHGNVTSTPTYTRITEIKDGVIHFDSPVPYLPGLGTADEYDYRESLTLGEFVKWWHRYEVETAIGLTDLRELLLKFNELENQEFGIEAKNNPPIMVQIGEELRYPDEIGATFRIISVDAEGLALDNGMHYSFSEFFHWIRNNHVEKIPEQEATQEAKKARDEKYEEILKEEHEENKLAEMKFEQGKAQVELSQSSKVRRDAGTLLTKLRDTYFQTTFLSFNDLWNMIKEVVEFVKRKHDRRSKGRFANVGSHIPGVLGTEFERIKQSAETEEVNKYKEAMEHWGIEQVKQSLYRTNSNDEAKACIMTLVHKGEMRWDDHHFWGTLNRLTARYTLRGAELYIPSPEEMPPGKSGEDLSIFAMDALWGEGTGAEWFMENTSKYNSNKNNFEFKFKQLENDPKGTGGPAGECKRMLQRWKGGGYVNAQEYEAMIDGAIKFGKMGAEDKMFFILAGVLARQGGRDDGETLLHMDRIGELDSKYLNQFPLLDFFTQEMVFDPSVWNDKEKKFGKNRKLNMSDYEKWRDEYFPNDFEECEAGSEFSRFMWEVMLMSEVVKTRVSKGIRNAENMDHDDAHLYIPPTTPSEIDGLTTGPTGQKKYFTNEGYANGYPGFNQYIISLTYSIDEETEEEKKKSKIIALRDGINAFIRFDAILDNRLLKKEGDHRARLDDRHYQRRSVVDSAKTGLHQKQMRNMVLEVGKAYGQDWSSWLYGPKTGSVFDPQEKKKQDEYERRIDTLKDLIPQLIAQDGGTKALEVVKRLRDAGLKDPMSEHGLRGIPKSKRPKPEVVAKLKETARARRRKVMMAGHGGHGGGHGGH